jgi:GNAT superfamily N-acetyltransferase
MVKRAMSNIRFTIGNERTYPFEEIIIDNRFGYPIRVNGILVGGISYWADVVRHPKEGRFKQFYLEGIEIKKSWRNHGIGTAVVKYLMKEYDVVVGSITEKEPIPFWQRFNPKMKTLSPEVMGPTMDTVHLPEVIIFYLGHGRRAGRIIDQLMTFADELNRAAKENPGSFTPAERALQVVAKNKV